MNVYPLEFRLGPLHVTGFGLMMMMAFLVAGWVMPTCFPAMTWTSSSWSRAPWPRR